MFALRVIRNMERVLENFDFDSVGQNLILRKVPVRPPEFYQTLFELEQACREGDVAAVKRLCE